MNRTVALCIFICSAATCVVLSVVAPTVLSDRNSFLKGFVSHELLVLLGVIVTITLASAANLHLELNKLEEPVRKRVFGPTRAAIKRAAYWLNVFAKHVVHPEHSEKNGVATHQFNSEEAPDEASS